MYEGGTNMTQQPIKRRNPFDIMAEEEKVEELAGDFHTEVIGSLSRSDLVLQAEEQGKTLLEVYPNSDMAKKQPRVVQRQQYIQQDDANREKYTSTMDVTLRRQIKIACAERGIMFAKFVEDACREKLAKEGYR